MIIDTKRKIKPFRDAKLIVIATEGEKTEPNYFDIFSNDSRIKIEIIPSIGGCSSPKSILNNLKKHIKKEDLKLKSDYDQLWLVCDVDKWKKRELSNTVTQAYQKRIKLAFSNPCFELWLFLHFNDINPKNSYECNEIIKLLEKSTNKKYSHSKLDIKIYKDRINDATTRAENLNYDQNERWPSKTGTHVFKVIKEIKKLSKKYG
jgi:hypothetical protein